MRLIDADAFMDEVTQQTEFIKVIDVSELTQVAEVLYEGVKAQIEKMPTIEAVQVVKCKDCRWFDKTEDSSYGYCHAMKHGYYSEHWEISIYRKYKEDFYCADGEKMDEEESNEADL